MSRTFIRIIAIPALSWMVFTLTTGIFAVPAGASDNIWPQADLIRAEAGFSADELKPLIGRWLRPDGGYILEIRKAAADGNLDAYYFNPRSINVHRAEAVRTGSDIKLVVELRDAGYPGSTYALLYKPVQDALVGYYYQAVTKQYFEVYFVRQKGP